MRDFVAPYDHSVVAPAARRRLRDRRHDEAAGVRDPAGHRAAACTGRRATRGTRRAPRAAPRAAPPPRWRAGMVPLAHGNDGGGSLRIPAACCGLVGLKAQRHRVSTAPDLGASALVIDGVLTRTVAETAALLDLLAGYERRRRRLAAAAGGAVRESAAEPAGAAADRLSRRRRRRTRRSTRSAPPPSSAPASSRRGSATASRSSTRRGRTASSSSRSSTTSRRRSRVGIRFSALNAGAARADTRRRRADELGASGSARRQIDAV